MCLLLILLLSLSSTRPQNNKMERSYFDGTFSVARLASLMFGRNRMYTGSLLPLGMLYAVPLGSKPHRYMWQVFKVYSYC